MSARGLRRAEVPAWSAVVSRRPPSVQPASPHSSTGLCRKGSSTPSTAWLGIQPATQATSRSNSCPRKASTARRTSRPSASSLTGSVPISSSPACSSQRRALAALAAMISRGVLTSPKQTNAALHGLRDAPCAGQHSAGRGGRATGGHAARTLDSRRLRAPYPETSNSQTEVYYEKAQSPGGAFPAGRPRPGFSPEGDRRSRPPSR